MFMAKEKRNQEQVLEDKDSLKDRRFYVTDLCAKGLRRLTFQAGPALFSYQYQRTAKET